MSTQTLIDNYEKHLRNNWTRGRIVSVERYDIATGKSVKLKSIYDDVELVGRKPIIIQKIDNLQPQN